MSRIYRGWSACSGTTVDVVAEVVVNVESWDGGETGGGGGMGGGKHLCVPLLYSIDR